MAASGLIRSVKQTVKQVLAERVLRQDSLRRKETSSAFGGLAPEHWGLKINFQGDLQLNQWKLTELASEFGTPLHVVNHARLVGNVERFLQPFHKLGDRVAIATSYKTNPLPGVLAALHEAGTWAEVISHFELWLALRLMADRERIIFNGPGKDEDALRLAITERIGLINIDSLTEIETISRLVREHSQTQDVGLRVVTSVGWAGQFGLAIANGDAWRAAERIAQDQPLRLRGLHLHLGTGLKDKQLYLQAIRETLQFGRRLRNELGIEIDCYDFGGGFGVPTVRTRDEWDDRLESVGHPARLAVPEDCPQPVDYAALILPVIEEFYPLPSASTNGTSSTEPALPQFLFEPGRAITSDAQSLLLKVVTTKPGRDGVSQVILDGGKNLTLPLEWETHQVLPTSRLFDGKQVPHDLFGPLCHPGDVVCRRRSFPVLNAGDVVAVMDAGAYFIPNQMNFSLPRPAVVMVRDGECSVIRRREQFEDLVRLDELFGEAML